MIKTTTIEERFSNESDWSTSNDEDNNQFKLNSIIIHQKRWAKSLKSNSVNSWRRRRLAYYKQIIANEWAKRNKLYIETVNNSDINQIEWLTGKHSIQNFPWGFNDLMKQVYLKMTSKDFKLEKTKWTDFKTNDNNEWTGDQQIVAERLFGSFPSLLVNCLTMKHQSTIDAIFWFKELWIYNI